MKKILCFAFLLQPFMLYSQDLVKDYEPPEIMTGSNLILSTSPNISIEKYVNRNPRSYNMFYANGSASFSNWRFMKKLNYSLSSELFMSASKYDFTILEIPKKPDTGNDENHQINLYFRLMLKCGMNYYIFKNIYTGAFIDYQHNISKESKPSSRVDAFPVLGIGRIYNTARVTEAINFQNVLMAEKVITKPLPGVTMKKLIVLLDKRTDRDFTSKFKEDDEIEFFTMIEKTLLEDGIIQNGLGSRTVLKLFQALTSSSFFYFPNYKGFLFQTEARVTSLNNYYQYNENEQKNGIESITLSGLYGMPLGLRNNLTCTLFFTLPVQQKYLDDFYDFNFHSPITLIENTQNGRYETGYHMIIPDFYRIDYIDKVKYSTGAQVSFFHILNKSAGLFASASGNFAKVENHERASVKLYSSLIYNILNRLHISTSAGFYKSYYTTYNFFVNGGMYYYIF